MTSSLEIQPVDLAWLGGLFDGEGSIHFSVVKKTNAIYARAFICNTSRVVVDRAKKIMSAIIGREIRYDHPRNAKYGYKPCWWVRVNNHAEVGILLEGLLPYLTGKRLQAELMLEYLKVAPGKGGRFQPFHYEFVEKMKHMNRRYAKGTYQSEQEAKLLAPHVDGEMVRPVQECTETLANSVRL